MLFMDFYKVYLLFQNKTAAHSLFLGYPYIPILTSICSYNLPIYIINVFYSVNLTLGTVTCIHNTRKMDQK